MGTEFNPEDRVGLNEKGRQFIAEIIATLPERERLVLSLSDYEYIDAQEIALILGISEEEVDEIETKAILRLRARLKQKLLEGESG